MMNKIRPSPSKSATLYKEGIIKTGNDGNKWIIIENKNGIKKWQKHKIIIKKSSNKDSKKVSKLTLSMFYHVKNVSIDDLEKILLKNNLMQNIYKILTTKIIPEINKLEIKTFIVPFPFSDDNIYWDNYPEDYITEKYNEKLSENNYMYFIFYLNNKGTNISELDNYKNIKIHFSELNKKMKIKIIDIFEKYLFGYYSWKGSNNYPMTISFNKNNSIKYVNKLILKNDDNFPSLYIKLNPTVNLIENKNTFYELIDFFINVCNQYYLLWKVFDQNIFFIVKSFNDKKIIDVLKNYVKSNENIISAIFYFSKNKNTKEKIIWKY